MTLEEKLQQIAIKVVDEVRVFYEFLSSEAKINPMQVYSKVNGMKNSIENDKYLLGEYIIKVREGLEDEDLYMSILRNLEKIAQNLDAATYRISVLLARNSKLDDIVTKLMITMSEKIIVSLTHLIQALRLLSINAKKSIEEAKNIIKIEEDVDELYRNLELQLFEKNQEDLVYVMLMKDVADRLEDSEDLIRDSATYVTYIAFGRT